MSVNCPFLLQTKQDNVLHTSTPGLPVSASQSSALIRLKCPNQLYLPHLTISASLWLPNILSFLSLNDTPYIHPSHHHSVRPSAVIEPHRIMAQTWTRTQAARLKVRSRNYYTTMAKSLHQASFFSSAYPQYPGISSPSTDITLCDVTHPQI